MTSADQKQEYRYVTCGELGASDAGARVAVRGWVNSTRDHGGLIFVDVRDRYGITQVVFDPRTTEQASYEAAGHLRSEDVIMAAGTVRRRPAGTENANLKTGEIEVAVDQLTVLNKSKTPPFPLHGDENVDESLRMKYRYIDLRRPAHAAQHRASPSRGQSGARLSRRARLPRDRDADAHQADA